MIDHHRNEINAIQKQRVRARAHSLAASHASKEENRRFDSLFSLCVCAVVVKSVKQITLRLQHLNHTSYTRKLFI